jgi:hypothetical protein
MEPFTRKNHRIWMVSFYLFLMAIFLYVKPSAAFGREGRIRPFGTGTKDATIFPVWSWVYVIAVVSYCITIYFAGYSLS